MDELEVAYHRRMAVIDSQAMALAGQHPLIDLVADCRALTSAIVSALVHFNATVEAAGPIITDTQYDKMKVLQAHLKDSASNLHSVGAISREDYERQTQANDELAGLVDAMKGSAGSLIFLTILTAKTSATRTLRPDDRRYVGEEVEELVKTLLDLIPGGLLVDILRGVRDLANLADKIIHRREDDLRVAAAVNQELADYVKHSLQTVVLILGLAHMLRVLARLEDADAQLPIVEARRLFVQHSAESPAR